MPEVSVLMPVYNAAATVGAAVESIVAQTAQSLAPLGDDSAASAGVINHRRAPDLFLFHQVDTIVQRRIRFDGYRASAHALLGLEIEVGKSPR